jgi:hypothetical protein
MLRKMRGGSKKRPGPIEITAKHVAEAHKVSGVAVRRELQSALKKGHRVVILDRNNGTLGQIGRVKGFPKSVKDMAKEHGYEVVAIEPWAMGDAASWPTFARVCLAMARKRVAEDQPQDPDYPAELAPSAAKWMRIALSFMTTAKGLDVPTARIPYLCSDLSEVGSEVSVHSNSSVPESSESSEGAAASADKNPDDALRAWCARGTRTPWGGVDIPPFGDGGDADDDAPAWAALQLDECGKLRRPLQDVTNDALRAICAYLIREKEGRWLGGRWLYHSSPPPIVKVVLDKTSEEALTEAEKEPELNSFLAPGKDVQSTEGRRHVTLCHAPSTIDVGRCAAAAPHGYGLCDGDTVEVRVSGAAVCSDKVAAARVSSLCVKATGKDVTGAVRSGFPHVTLWHGEGTPSRLAAALFGGCNERERAELGDVKTFPLDLRLRGRVQFG